jgi:hypothetical protein
VSHRLDVTPWLETKVEASLAHRSEVRRGALPGSVARLPAEKRAGLLATEWYTEHSRIPSTDPTSSLDGGAGFGKIEHMFDLLGTRQALAAEGVRAWVRDVAREAGPRDHRARLDLITALEELKCAAEGLQADLAVAVDDSMRERAAERGAPEARQGRGVAAEIALARRESLHRGQQSLGLAKVLRRELPFTRAALRRGRINPWRATIIARETACLSWADRVEVDRRVAGDPEALEVMGDRELGNAVRRHAYELDAEAWVTRRRIAESERRVTLRPAPDVMSRLSAELPVAQGVAVFKTLADHADSLRAGGDPRSRGQLMADTMVNRLLGTETPTELPVLTHVVVADDVLFGTREEAAQLDGYGPIPAELARELVKTASDEGLAQLRRVYVTHTTGALVAPPMQGRAASPAAWAC